MDIDLNCSALFYSVFWLRALHLLVFSSQYLYGIIECMRYIVEGLICVELTCFVAFWFDLYSQLAFKPTTTYLICYLVALSTPHSRNLKYFDLFCNFLRCAEINCIKTFKPLLHGANQNII